MKKPTIQEIRARILEKGWLTVSAQKFFDVNEGSEWCDPKTGKPYKFWKRVLATWYHNSLRFGESKKICRRCGKYGDYTEKDDTGQQYWLCEDHKPRKKKRLPEELTKDLCKMPSKHTIDINTERNRQRKGLEKGLGKGVRL